MHLSEWCLDHAAGPDWYLRTHFESRAADGARLRTRLSLQWDAAAARATATTLSSFSSPSPRVSIEPRPVASSVLASSVDASPPVSTLPRIAALAAARPGHVPDTSRTCPGHVP